MAPAAAFHEVLDGFVEGLGFEEPAAAGRWPAGIATRSLYGFEGAGSLSRHSRAASDRPLHRLPEPHDGAGEASPPHLRLVRSEAQPRPLRLLTSDEQEALGRLVALGARLDAGFTREELRRAFRSLARAYHPDSHPGLRASEKAHLAAVFASARHAYDRLKTAA